MQDFSPQRIVCLQPSASIILRDLGESDRIAACTRYCVDMCSELRGRQIVADSWSADASQITAAAPDLVIASVSYQEKALTEILKSGARFLGMAPKTLADIYADIAAIAGIVGNSAGGREVIARMQDAIADMRCQTAGRQYRPRVFCEEWGKPILVSQPWIKELVEAAGGEFVAEPGKAATPEQVVAANPDVLIAAWCGAGDRVPLEKVVRQRNWLELNAVRDGRVYCISDELLNTPAPTLLKGLQALAWAIAPGHFSQPPGIRVMEIA